MANRCGISIFETPPPPHDDGASLAFPCCGPWGPFKTHSPSYSPEQNSLTVPKLSHKKTFLLPKARPPT